MKILKNGFSFALLCMCAVFINGCAAATSVWQYTPWGTQKGAGFFHGLLDGFIALWCLIISAFTSKVHVYDVKNIGFCYDLGFAFGIILFLACLAVDGGDDGGDKKSKGTQPPDPGKPENPPGPKKKLPKRFRIRGTNLNVNLNRLHWRN